MKTIQLLVGLMALAALALLCAYWIEPSRPAQLTQAADPAARATPPVVEQTAARVRLTLIDGKLALEGRVPDSKTRHALIDAAKQGFGAIDDKALVAERRVAPAPWLTALPAALNAKLAVLANVKSWALTLEGDRAVLEGEAQDDAAKEQTSAQLQKLLGPSLNWDNRLKVATPARPLHDRLNQAIGGRVIEFEKDKAVLTAAGRAVLDELLPLIQVDQQTRFAVTGHTDDLGDIGFNQMLSENRARAVREYFVNQGVRAERMRARGFGPDKPIADNKTSQGRARNRRVEFAPYDVQ